MSHREAGYYVTEFALEDKIVERMNARSLNLTESITEHPETHLHLHCIDLEPRFIGWVPATQMITINLLQWPPKSKASSSILGP